MCTTSIAASRSTDCRKVLRDHAELATGNRMSVRESFACARLHLWDENSKRLLSFAQARALSAA